MNYKIFSLALIFILSLAACNTDQPVNNNNENSSSTTRDLSDYRQQEISSEDLASWNFYGMGKAFDAGNGQFCLMEDDSTVGAILISPESYTGDVVIRYKTLALTSATVLVAMHSVSDIGSDGELNVPEDYNGNMGLWINDKYNYFFAFRNASHNFPPFIRKYPNPGGNALASAEENFMLPGKYYEIEFGREGQNLWLSVDGERIVETNDEDMWPGGHIALRIRGTAGLKAACLVKEMVIYTPE